MSDPVARLNDALKGRYAIERELGEGGMATVYLADDLKHERKVALGGVVGALLTFSPLVLWSPADDGPGPDSVVAPSMTPEARADAIDPAERILRTRILGFGVEEPLVQGPYLKAASPDPNRPRCTPRHSVDAHYSETHPLGCPPFRTRSSLG